MSCRGSGWRTSSCFDQRSSRRISWRYCVWSRGRIWTSPGRPPAPRTAARRWSSSSEEGEEAMGLELAAHRRRLVEREREVLVQRRREGVDRADDGFVAPDPRQHLLHELLIERGPP